VLVALVQCEALLKHFHMRVNLPKFPDTHHDRRIEYFEERLLPLSDEETVRQSEKPIMIFFDLPVSSST
jgi:hypothetical protein